MAASEPRDTSDAPAKTAEHNAPNAAGEPRLVEGAHVPFTGFNASHAVDFALLTTRQNQVQLNVMADTKANIMITVSSVVFSIVLSQLDKPELRLPLLTMGATALVALVLSILAVLPRVTIPRKPGGEPDWESAEFNLFFFGHFATMSYPEYRRRMQHILGDDGQLYERLVADVYGLGAFLAHHKYRYLRWSYIVLIIGVVLTGLEVAGMSIWGGW